MSACDSEDPKSEPFSTFDQQTNQQTTNSNNLLTPIVMILEATLRHGRQLAAFSKRQLIGSTGTASRCNSWSTHLLAAPTTANESLRHFGHHSGSGISTTLPTAHSSYSSHHHRRQHRFIHSDKATSAAAAAAAIGNPSLPNLNSLTPSIRDAILSDLQTVDINNNGVIDSDELKLLLSKHATSFTDEEIVELTELFYASTGGRGVEVMRFLEAVDATLGEKSTSGGGEMSVKEPLSPLVAEGKFRTHPLGIGTCASEYSE